MPSQVLPPFQNLLEGSHWESLNLTHGANTLLSPCLGDTPCQLPPPPSPPQESLGRCSGCVWLPWQALEGVGYPHLL